MSLVTFPADGVEWKGWSRWLGPKCNGFGPWFPWPICLGTQRISEAKPKVVGHLPWNLLSMSRYQPILLRHWFRSSAVKKRLFKRTAVTNGNFSTEAGLFIK